MRHRNRLVSLFSVAAAAGMLLFSAAPALAAGGGFSVGTAGISLFGLFLFECLWEARSRYLLNYLPVFVAVTVTVLCALASRLRRRA